MTAVTDVDVDPGRLLRPFALAGGAPSAHGPHLDLASMVAAAREPEADDELNPEQATVLRLCAGPRSVAELAAELAMPPSLTRLLVTDMVTAGALRVGEPPEAEPTGSLLQAVLDGLRAL
ncbi:DUF742 domain-containing protein [Actinorugispora endophytica]|uniref:Uncharacterized protein DUF742 n=1 Tax=Actinorugispora endophytica TaxID=1605990 RepID=A0A4R6UJ28_9ACTN|nr:DUF742 domain-containing protein [Actinorugispora endophytica]TDQ45419.1 uncharacterized protein DUF742 [Actinorugispora endophytica]